MLFRKDIEPSCSYCKHGTRLTAEQVGCLKKGIVPAYAMCRKFQYDPLKRVPERPRKLHETPEDDTVFEL